MNARNKEHTAAVDVWQGHQNEAYRRDMSHWRGEGRWNDETWLQIGQKNLTRLTRIGERLGRRYLRHGPPVVLEWGPGGGSNLLALAPAASLLVGVDISQANLDECERILNASPTRISFNKVLVDGPPTSLSGRIPEPVDVILSTAVFQHFPSKQYGIEVLQVMSEAMRPGGYGMIQIRFDDGNPKFKPKSVDTYAQDHVYATSYGLSEFWDALKSAGFAPLEIFEVASANNYAFFAFRR